jgi:thiamine-phosphate pyrophosphorylase
VLLYYITDRAQFAGNESTRRESLLARIAEAARAGVDYIQLREKDLDASSLTALACEALQRVRAASATARVLINSHIEIARTVGADGVHLTSHDLRSDAFRELFARPQLSTPEAHHAADFVVGASCHSLADVGLASSFGADFAVLAPIFEKRGTDALPLGISALSATARAYSIPVLALGGVSLTNAAECLRAGAAGIAGIRLFQQGDVTETVRQLRAVGAETSED